MPRDVKKALKKDKPAIIAEVKKASPSKGVIREDFEPVEIAKVYEENGASAISILTEEDFFLGHLDYLGLIKRNTKIPILRKDFIFTKYQVLESLVYGADFILLIAKILSANKLRELTQYAFHLGLEVLVEIHDKEDLTKAIFAGANIIGINHRNLDDFSMDLDLTKKLLPLIPKGKIVVAESGIDNKEFIDELFNLGVNAFLIGEYFMRQKDIGKKIKEFSNGVSLRTLER